MRILDASLPFCYSQYGTKLASPIGVAAGPQTQLTQNIVASYLAGARFIELKTVQILDDLDDLIGALGLVVEQVRSAVMAVFFAVAAVSIQVGGVVLALSHPPLALATAIIMFVTLLYRTVTSVHQGLQLTS